MYVIFGEKGEAGYFGLHFQYGTQEKGRRYRSVVTGYYVFVPQELYNFIHRVRVTVSTSKISVLLLVYSPSPVLPLNFPSDKEAKCIDTSSN